MFGFIDRLLARRWVKVLGVVLTVAGIGFLVWGLAEVADDLPEVLRSLRWSWAAISVLALVVMHVATVAMITAFLHELGEPTPARHVYSAVLLANLAKYVPGGVWQVGSHLQWFQRLGVASRPAAVVWGLNALAAVGGLTLVGSALWLASESGEPVWMGPTAVAGVIAGGGLLLPMLRRYLVRRLGGVETNVRSRVAVGASVLALVVGLAMAAHGASLPMALDLDVPVLVAAAAMALAWVVGFVFVVSPQGLGAREVALVVLLAPWLDASEVAVVALVSRVGFLAADAISALAAAPLAPRSAAGGTGKGQ